MLKLQFIACLQIILMIIINVPAASAEGICNNDLKTPYDTSGVITVMTGSINDVVSRTLSADSRPVLAAGDVSDVPGAVMQMPLNLTSSGEVVALQCDLSYDHTLLTYQQISAGSLTSAFTVSANPVGDKIRIMIYNFTSTPVTGGSGSVAQIQFEVADGAAAGQTSTLGLSGATLANQQGRSIPAVVNNGRFDVLHVPGLTATVTTKEAELETAATQPAASAAGTVTVNPAAGGIASFGSEAMILIPAGALKGTSSVEVKVREVDSGPALPAGFRLAGGLYEFSVKGAGSYSFAEDVTVKLSFDPGAISAGETPTLQYFDEVLGEWEDTGGTISGNYITAQVDRLARFAVLVAEKEEEQETVQLNDISGHWAFNYINELLSLGSVNGYPDDSFRPDNPITRAEFAAILVNSFKFTSQGGKTFADTAGHWAGEYIAVAAANGVVNGYDASNFGPDDLITREQIAVMIVKATRLSQAAEETLFADSVSISSWAREAVVTITENGIMKGYPDNTVQPQGNATRAEAVTAIVKALSH